MRDIEPRRDRFAHPGVGIVLAFLVVLGPLLLTSEGLPDDTFQYEGATYVMDPYTRLFDASTDLGAGRRRLFDQYVVYSDEGKKRPRGAGSSDAEQVWSAMHREEQATFLAVTAAAQALKPDNDTAVLSWLETLKQIRGGQAPNGGADYPNDQAFRLYVVLTQKGVDHILDGTGAFKNVCTKKSFEYGGIGSTHPNFCPPPTRFPSDAKTDNSPNMQFNLDESSRCSDIDLDYDRVLHLTKSNSNVLAHPWRFLTHRPHAEAFFRQYCDPGFRIRPQ